MSHKTSDLPADPATADPKRLVLLEKNGAGERTRTADLLITNQLLYQLSYAGARGGYTWAILPSRNTAC